MSNITNEFVESYIRELLPEEEGLFREMEIYAEEHHVPIVHKEVAALLNVITKSIGAKKSTRGRDSHCLFHIAFL